MPARVLAMLSAVLSLAGCGYALVGRSTYLPQHIRVIYLIPFENRTQRPEIEQRVTEAVAQEFARRARYRIVTQPEAADAILEGAITGFRTDPVQFNPEGRATRVETVVSLRATLRDRQTDQILWSQDGLLFREQWEIPETESEFFDQETLALGRIAEGAASTLVNSILEGF